MQARMMKHLRGEEMNWFELAWPRWYQTLAEGDGCSSKEKGVNSESE